MDQELLRVWQLLHELSEQLAYNQKLTNALQSQTKALREEAKQTGTNFNLRRLNTDISKEFFDSELERANAQIIIEHQGLVYENKQLSMLLKEYESTMETIMNKFRNHALAASQHELTLTRHYEMLLLARDAHGYTSDLVFSANAARAFQRLASHLRNLIRSLAGESPIDESSPKHDMEYDTSAYHSFPTFDEVSALIESLDEKVPGYPGYDGPQDWAVERECEIARLEAENAELRKQLAIDSPTLDALHINIAEDLERLNTPRHPILSERRRNGSAHSQQGSGERWEMVTPAYWESGPPPVSNNSGSGGSPQSYGNPHQQGGAPLQRAIDLSGGMRMMQGRRAGMFGTTQQRGALSGGAGRGVLSMPMPAPSSSFMWSNQPASPAPPIMPERGLGERQWQGQSSSSLDLSR